MLQKACKVLYIQLGFFVSFLRTRKKNTPSKHSICNIVNLSGKQMQIANKDQDKKKIHVSEVDKKNREGAITAAQYLTGI